MFHVRGVFVHVSFLMIAFHLIILLVLHYSVGAVVVMILHFVVVVVVVVVGRRWMTIPKL